MNNNIIDLIKNDYNSKNLSEAQIYKLENLNKTPFMPNAFATGIIILTLALLGLFYINKTDNLTKIASEVIYNHKKNLPSEFLVGSMVKLNSRLTKLEFKIINSKQLKKYITIGGRYCSIQGRTAAQLKIKSGNSISTLYQSDFLDINFDKLPYEVSKGGVLVRIWVEDNILFALATSL